MSLRALVKKTFRNRPPFAKGMYSYFGTQIFHPIRSHIIDRACIEGIYENDLFRRILIALKPETTFIDVGANIGLISVAVLGSRRDVKVISVEAGPATLNFLSRTCNSSGYSDRWTVLGVAAGRTDGEAEFHAGDDASSAFDGLRDTGRGGAKKVASVPVRRLDSLWADSGRPHVSAIKIDIEGGEIDAIEGARDLIKTCRPAIFVEWTTLNLHAYGVEPNSLISVSRDLNYRLFALPSMVHVDAPIVLEMEMLRGDLFLLAPL